MIAEICSLEESFKNKNICITRSKVVAMEATGIREYRTEYIHQHQFLKSVLFYPPPPMKSVLFKKHLRNLLKMQIPGNTVQAACSAGLWSETRSCSIQ